MLLQKKEGTAPKSFWGVVRYALAGLLELGGPPHMRCNIVTYNNAYKSTTCVWYDITLQRRSLTT
jgi:hypothetical protein